MILARIVGTVVATRKDPRLVSNKLLVARPIDPQGKSEGNYLVAVDTVDTGPQRAQRIAEQPELDCRFDRARHRHAHP